MRFLALDKSKPEQAGMEDSATEVRGWWLLLNN